MNIDTVLNEMKSRGYKVFESGNYNLNVVGIRNVYGKVNSFDDLITVFYKVAGEWRFHEFKATTDPGLYYLKNPMNINGTAILCPGQYPKSHKIGLHRNAYSAMVQIGKLRVFRDRDKDEVLDFVQPQDAIGTGINIHKAGSSSTIVDRWSAGCQVFAREADFQQFMNLVYKQRDSGLGDTITYTLLELPL